MISRGIERRDSSSFGRAACPGAAGIRGRIFGKMTSERFTAIVEQEGDGFVALCPELDVASQGPTVEEATSNLKEAVELFLENAGPEEIRRRLHSRVFVTSFEAVRA